MKVSETDYTLAITAEDGTQYDISDFADDLGWEENEKELATSMSFSVGTDNEQLLKIIKLGCLASVLSSGKEKARGYINTAKVKSTGSKDSITVKAYDDLFALQKSEDQLYFAAGQMTKDVLTQIFAEWNLTISNYTGANVAHEKLVYRSGSLADNILDILDDAVKKGGEKSILRSTLGQIEVVTRGSNQEIYCFDEDCSISAESETSIADIVTRVKVVGKADKDEGRPPVEATLNGLTQFGVRQKIYQREKDATAEEAQTAAQKILDEKGKISEKVSVQSPDVPDIRKGDRVRVSIGDLNDDYFVLGVRHDASNGIMTMDLEKAVIPAVAEEEQKEEKTYKVGDVVNFHGGTHYMSSWPGSKGSSAGAGPATITMDPTCANNGGAHPWHLIHTDGSSNVYGWVDEGTFD